MDSPIGHTHSHGSPIGHTHSHASPHRTHSFTWIPHQSPLSKQGRFRFALLFRNSFLRKGTGREGSKYTREPKSEQVGGWLWGPKQLDLALAARRAEQSLAYITASPGAQGNADQETQDKRVNEGGAKNRSCGKIYLRDSLFLGFSFLSPCAEVTGENWSYVLWPGC